jgi:hypothetical protein
MHFPEEDYTRFDYWAIVSGRGVIAVELALFEQCHGWLLANQYEVVTFDFCSGISPVVEGLGKFLRWEQQFGYKLSPESRNLNSLRDGYLDYVVSDERGAVTIFKEIERAWTEDEGWTRGLLSMASELSLTQLSLGKRYFTMIGVNDRNSPIIGKVFDECTIHVLYSPPAPVSSQ